MTTEAQIEALLFYKGEPLSISYIAEILEITPEETKETVNQLKDSLDERGLTLIEKDNKIVLGTDSRLSSIIEKTVKKDLSKDIGKAGLETLALIIYRHPIERSEIDYIRGVNSSFILRNLITRGLVEKKKHNKNFVYEPTLKTMSFLGVSNVLDIPNFKDYNKILDRFTSHEED